MNRRARQRHGRNRAARFAARSQAHRHQRRTACANLEDHSSGRALAARTSCTSRRSSSAWIPAPRNSSPSLRTCIPPTKKKTSPSRPPTPKDRDSGQRPEPHRAGNRVRLLLLPRIVRAARRWLRNDHGELQSGDGFHRLRHLRPPVLRAADAGRRARHRRTRKAARRDRAIRRADAAESGARTETQRRAHHRHRARNRSTSRKTAAGSAACSTN